MTEGALGPAASRRNFLGPGVTETAIFALSIVTGPLVSRALGDDKRGSYAAVVVPVQLLGWAFLLGVPYGASMLTRHVSRRRLVDSAWRLAMVGAIPIGVVGWFVAPMLLSDHPSTTVSWFRIGMVGVVLALPATTAVQLRLIATGGTWRTSLAQNLYLVVYTASIVALAVTDQLTLATALASWVGALVVSQVFVLAAYHGFPHGTGDTSTLRRQLRIGRPHAVITLATISVGRLDQVFLSVLDSSAVLGHYAVAATTAQLSLPVANGIATVVLPDAFARGESGIQTSALRAVVAISVALGVVSAVVAPWVLPFVFGADFGPSVSLLWWMLPGQVMFNTAWVLSARHLGTGRAGDAAHSIGLAAIVNAVLLAPAIVWFGAAGAAALTCVCQGLFLIGVVARRNTGTDSIAETTSESITA